MRKAKIVGVKKIGKKNTVDIEVNSDEHIFYADGFVVSNSHAVAYAVNAYLSAWYKANHTREFFLSYLHYSSEKQDPHREVYELVSEAKLFDIEIKVPKINKFQTKFFIDQNTNNIYFGVKDIKSLTGVTGDKVVSTIEETEKKIGKSAKDFTWMDILIYLSPSINSTAFKTLCSVGFFSTSSNGISRNRALYEYLIFNQLTKSELAWVIENYKSRQWRSLIDCFKQLAPTKKNGGGTSKEDRSQIINNEVHFLNNPPYSLEDSPSWIIDQEKKFLGCPISYAKIESSDTSSANTTCKEIVNGKTGKNLCVVGNIAREMSCKVKKGKSIGQLMSFLTIEDETCSIDNVVVFPETRKNYEYILYEGNNLLFCGEVSKKDGSFIIEKIHEI
jgi:DNA polymerase III alpha subunit